MARKKRKTRRTSKRQRAYKALVKKHGVKKAAKLWHKRVYGRSGGVTAKGRVTAKRGRLARRRTLRMIKQMKRMALLEDQIRALALKPSFAAMKAVERKLGEYKRLAK